MKYPAEFYRASPRLDQGLPQLDYPLHDRIVTVTSCGRLCIGRRKINLSRAFAGQDIGIREVAEKIWLVTFMHYDLGLIRENANYGAKQWKLEVVDMTTQEVVSKQVGTAFRY